MIKKEESSRRPERPDTNARSRAPRAKDRDAASRYDGTKINRRRTGATSRPHPERNGTTATPSEAEVFVTVGRRVFRPHPLARLWPPMTRADFEAMKESIRRAGKVQVPIKVTPDNYVLDGLQRLAACCEVKVEPDVEVCEDEATFLEVVIDANERRRHLSHSQRALVGARLATLKPGRPDETARIRAITQEAAAEMFGVSRTQIQAARKVLDRGTEELIRLVALDELAVSTAAHIADLDHAEQRQIVQGGLAAIERRAARICRPAEKPESGERTHRGEGGSGSSAAGDPDGPGPAHAQAGNLPGASTAGMGEVEADASTHATATRPCGSSAGAETSGVEPPVRGAEEQSAVGDRGHEATASPHGDVAPPGPGSAADEPEPVHENECGISPDQMGAGPEGTETSEPGDEPPPVDRWIAGLSLGKQLADRRFFDLEARIWYEWQAVVKKIRDFAGADPRMAEFLKLPTCIAFDTIATIFGRMEEAPHPDQWQLCGACEGGQSNPRADCGACGRRGYETDLPLH